MNVISKLEQVISAASELIRQDTHTLVDPVGKQVPSSDMDREKLRALQEERSNKFDIEILDTGSHLTFPADYPTKLELYGDPVNLKFPVDTKERAANARVRFKTFFETYKEQRSRAVVHARIVRAELGFGITPSFDPADVVDQWLPKDLQEELLRLDGTKCRTIKGFPTGDSDGGIHIHGLERENNRTKPDGGHAHWFITKQPIDLNVDYGNGEGPELQHFEAGSVLLTDSEGGEHYHALAEPASDGTQSDGEHYHALTLPDGVVLETVEDGAHQHDLQVSTTAFDGLHTHELALPNGEVIQSAPPSEIWELIGNPTQAHMAALPPASFFALLAPETRGAIEAFRTCSLSKPDRAAAEAVEESSAKATFDQDVLPALKVADPKFLLKRLQLQQPAGLLSARRRQSRIDEPQVLVNEVGALKGSFAWGVVKHAAPVLYKVDEIPDVLWEGVAPSLRKSFEHARTTKDSNQEVFYLPCELLATFDTPKKLKRTPAGRRFAGKVDLSQDVVEIRACAKCETPFEDDAAAHMYCEDCRQNPMFVEKRSADRHVRIVKTEETAEERIVFGVVLVPNDTDAQGDIYDAEEVRKAAYSFMEVGKGQLRLMHEGEALSEKVAVLETYVSKQEEQHGEEVFPAGTWFLTSRVYDSALWGDVKSGKWTGYSIGGSALREPLA